MVSAMPGGSLAPREKAAKALEEIRSRVLQVRNSDKVPGDLLNDTLVAIDEAQTALLTDGAQTIAYSLATVGQEIQAIEAKLSGNAPQTAMQSAMAQQPAQAQPQYPAPQAAPEQRQQPQQMAANEPNPQTAANEAKPQTAANEPKPQMAANESKPQTEAAKPSAAEATQPNPAQNTIANRPRNDIVGKTLYDSAGNEVAKIQDVKTAPDGKIQAVEIDVGGFLGIGARRIPVPVDQLQLKGDRIQATSLTQDQIRNLPHEAK